MITLVELRWSNMFSYGENNVLSLDGHTLTQIIGLNGNGKSSIPLIIEEVLFNKNSKGIKKASIVNRYTGGSYSASLDFIKDDDFYTIDIDRKTNLKVKFFKNGVDISSHTATNTYKAIEEVIGIEFKLSSQLIYQNLNNSLQFLTATDTSRKKFLIDILQLTEYVQLFEIFKEAVRQHSVGVTNLQAKAETIEKWIANNSNIDRTPMELKEIDELDVSAEEQRIAELKNEISTVKEKNTKIAKNNHYRDLLAKIDIKAIQSIKTVDSPSSYDKELSELGAARNELSSHSAHLKKLSGLGDSCPTCEQDIPSEFKAKLIQEEETAINTLRSKIDEIEAVVARIKKENEEYSSKQAKIKEWEDTYRSLDKDLPANLIHKDSLEAELDELSKKVISIRASLKDLIAYNEEAARHNSRIQVISEQAEEFQKELREIQSRLEEETVVLSDLELLKKSFSTNGLIAYKIENLVKDLEDLTNDYLSELSDGRFTIDFEVVSDKLNVNITDNGNVIDIAEVSSGELARINTATLLALRRLMGSISKNNINILFLDEVTTVLDDIGKEKLVEVLLKEENLNTYMVSHGWTHPLLNKLEVIKEDEISRIEQHG